MIFATLLTVTLAAVDSIAQTKPILESPNLDSFRMAPPLDTMGGHIPRRSISDSASTQVSSLHLDAPSPADRSVWAIPDSNFQLIMAMDILGTILLVKLAARAESPLLGAVAWGFIPSFPLLVYGRPILATSTFLGGLAGAYAGFHTAIAVADDTRGGCDGMGCIGNGMVGMLAGVTVGVAVPAIALAIGRQVEIRTESTLERTGVTLAIPLTPRSPQARLFHARRRGVARFDP